MILLIDNYDSFTYNLYQFLCELGAEVTVRRNDEITIEEIRVMDPERIIISPGPCTPSEAGISVDLIRELAPEYPILGVCLGHQAIGEAFGAKVVQANEIVHGKTSSIQHDGEGIFQSLPNPITATRYHSLIIDPESVPASLSVCARSEDGTIMAVRHREFDVSGVQFHPESILTEAGHELLANFIGARRPVLAARGY